MSVHAKERSTLVLDVEVRDERGDLVTPTSLTWTVTDRLGAILAGPTSPTLAAQFSVVLSGDDLLIQDGEASPAMRVFLVDATYDSDLGSGFPLRQEAIFFVDDLVGDNNV